MNHIARRAALVGLATIGLMVLAACAGDDSEKTIDPSTSDAEASYVVSVSGAEYAFDAPDMTAVGLKTLRFTNEGQEDHELHLMQLDDGVTIHSFNQTLHQEGLDAALAMASTRGHIATISPGEAAEAIVELPEGDYVLICQVPSPDDDVAHALKGMVKALTVTPAP